MGLKASSLAGQQKSHSSTTPYATNLFPSTFGGGAHVFAGYGVNFDKIYAGGEINVGLYGGESKTTYHINLTDSNASSSVGATWGATGRLGYYVSPTTLFYGRLGAVSSSFKYSGSSAASGEIVFPGKYTRTSRSGFLYGVGLESALNDHITVRMEGAQINYQPFYYRSGTNYKKDRPLLNEINLGVGYKLSPMSGPAMEDAYEESVGTGFYFGADGGLSTLLNTRHVKGVSGTNAATTYDGDGSTVDPSWGLFAGYSYHMDRFFMAGEVQLALTKPVISESIINNGVTTESYSNTLRWLWALTARPGYIFNHGTIGYGRIGIIGGSFSHSAQHSGAQRTLTTGGSSKAYGLGIRLGAGLETFINPHLSLRSEYILDYLPGIKIRDKTNGAIKEETSMINNEFKLGLSWHLDP